MFYWLWRVRKPPHVASARSTRLDAIHHSREVNFLWSGRIAAGTLVALGKVALQPEQHEIWLITTSSDYDFPPRPSVLSGAIGSTMNAKTSITLSGDVLTKIDRLAGSSRSRSAFIEKVLRKYLLEREKVSVPARDLGRINRAAEQLNSEAADVMEFQTVVN